MPSSESAPSKQRKVGSWESACEGFEEEAEVAERAGDRNGRQDGAPRAGRHGLEGVDAGLRMFAHGQHLRARHGGRGRGRCA